MGCATCVITRGVSSIRVSSRRLAVPLQDMDFERHATFFFALSEVVRGIRRENQEFTSGVKVF